MYFWNERIEDATCFYPHANTGFDEAIVNRSKIKTFRDVNVVIRTPSKFRAKA